MKDRIFGLETEFGCLPPDSDPFLSPDFISVKTKDCVFYREALGIVDIHYRGRDEPPGNGGFLFNGGRLYIDMGHVEYASPECSGDGRNGVPTGRSSQAKATIRTCCPGATSKT